MNTVDFTDLLLNEYKERYDVSEDRLKEIKRIIIVGLIPENILEKRDAARLIHLFFRYTRIEEDEENWDKAKVLKDLYDCRSCVDHVAQIYVKGIIRPVSIDVFGMRNAVTDKEAIDIVNNVFNKEIRILP